LIRMGVGGLSGLSAVGLPAPPRGRQAQAGDWI
jgi:hypothetical protein